ncbi:efflux RND transporter periplasmic adaptor subunit [Leptothrix ochracea]|uniref:efflux RND transporter periplasmic adaptor subunit n=1 Tax=Leptothrix ochracea TaxID=735331 RepID=UPI0034E20B57
MDRVQSDAGKLSAGWSRLGVALGFATGLALLVSGCGRQAPAPEAVRAVRVMTVQTESRMNAMLYAADIRPQTESRLGFRVSGKLVQRLAAVGMHVKAGQLLAQLDAVDLKLGQDAAQASLQAAQTNLDQVSADNQRFQGLRAQGFISAAELERSDTALKAAKSQLEAARAQAGVQQHQTQYAALSADVAGVITATEAEVGQVLTAGTPVLRLAHDGPRDAVFAVPEDQVNAVKALVGRKEALRVQVWGSDQSLPATVREVAAVADPVARTFQVKADLGRAAVPLGQTATLSMPGGPGGTVEAGGLYLPLTALSEQAGKTVVWLLDEASMTVKPQPVELGVVVGDRLQIKAGLQAGQVVVTAGVHVLTPGLAVRRYVESPAAASATR